MVSIIKPFITAMSFTSIPNEFFDPDQTIRRLGHGASDIFIHENTHALGNIGDEYGGCYGFGVNNALTQEEAERKWGSLVGQVDPFYDEFIAFHKDKKNNIYWGDLSIDELFPREDYRVGYVRASEKFLSWTEESYGGDCFSPTKTSLMNVSSGTILGSVNRRHLEEIFKLFSGQ